ncbi:TlpA family protein disulfide reductase [Gelidibacter sp. F63206]|uniref:TlpA family protein disulfide reductase n=1 Tax=Gelidibacter sp. F63206 TaxID=2926425 RepID=UPI001FF5A44A|nr:TlpA disulfide reductase family protein [Gelidibacter sp. F63206]MCK0114818.1 TlpA family protein disulfide reductase [Gelidibacter sp. F63206]
MKTIAKFTKAITFKSGVITMLVFACIVNSSQAQDDTDNVKTNPDLQQKLNTKKNQGDEYFEKFLAHPNLIKIPEGYEDSYANDSFIDFQRLSDKKDQVEMRMIEAFLEKYPQNENYEKAMGMLYNLSTHPDFIADKVPESLIQYLNDIRYKEAPKSERLNMFKSLKRALPVDEQARAQYLKMTNDLVANVLSSNASLERKYRAEHMLLIRNFIIAHKIHTELPERNNMEASYWDRFDIQFWDSLRLQMEAVMNKYGTLEQMADDIKNLLVSIGDRSKAVGDSNWKYFFEITGPNSPQADQIGIKTLHKFATDNLAAIEAIKEMDGTKPLEMTFTAMDGTQVDLAKMRGKVVLIDFWTPYCGPCIAVMPHLKALYDKYRDQGFEVIGIVSGAAGRESHIQDVLQKTKANWPLRLEGGADTSVSFTSLYQINSYPTVWLLKKEGVIVDKNARGERLEPLIRKYLNLE